MKRNKLSAPLQRRMIAVIGLFLLPLLTSCAGSNNTPALPVVISPQIDTELTEETPVPAMPLPFTYRASLFWNADLLLALGQCNRDKASIREQDDRRKELYEQRPER
ncbi:TPA: hypothetical protein QHY04_004306, partial [Citrobacter koseri]|nr:hypothetical protein [Citrobacter koseri]HDZ7990327.1 hypothetical protein [Citrobacter koseri]